MSCCEPNTRKGKPRPMQKGRDGKSAYDIWKENQCPGADVSLAAYLDSMTGHDGKSAYDIWLEEGNIGTERQFLASLKGKQGDNGPSAYETWLAAGNTGSEADYLASLKGSPGKSAEIYMTSVTPDTSWMSDILSPESYADGDNPPPDLPTYYKTRVALPHMPLDHVGLPIIHLNLKEVPLRERHPVGTTFHYDIVQTTEFGSLQNILIILLTIDTFDSYLNIAENTVTPKPFRYAPEIFVAYQINR